MNKLFSTAVFAAAALLFASISYADIVYDEATDGDLPEDPIGSAFTLVAGVNTIQGSQFFENDGGLDALDTDNFLFNIPTGYEVTSVEYIASNYATVGTPDIVENSFRLEEGPAFDAIDAKFTRFDNLSSFPYTYTVDDGLPLEPLGSSSYNVSITSGIALSNGESVSYDYEVNLTVAAIPEPSSLLVIGLGAVVPMIRRRRKP